MDHAERTAPNVRCDACGCAFVPDLCVAVQDEVRLTFFTCPWCGARYVVSASDPAKRQDKNKDGTEDGTENETEGGTKDGTEDGTEDD